MADSELVKVIWMDDGKEIRGFQIVTASESFQKKIQDAIDSGLCSSEFEAYKLVLAGYREYQ